MRIAGLALELAFYWLSLVGLFALEKAHFVEVAVSVSEGSSKTLRKRTFSVQAIHQEAIMKGIQDVLPRLHHAGFVIVGTLVPQKGHLAKHDVVLEHRKIGEPCVGQYSGELKLRTHPAQRTLMRSDCAGLFQVATRESSTWLGQVVICIEVSDAGVFLQSRAELMVRGRPRNEAVNLWGWVGAPCLAPPRPNLPAAQPAARAMPKAVAGPPRAPPPMRAAPLPKPSFQSVWRKLRKYVAGWTNDRVVLLKQYFMEMGSRCKTNVTNCSRVVKSNRLAPLNWRVRVHYDNASTKAEGRVSQGGAAKPVIVSKAALLEYHDSL